MRLEQPDLARVVAEESPRRTRDGAGADGDVRRRTEAEEMFDLGGMEGADEAEVVDGTGRIGRGGDRRRRAEGDERGPGRKIVDVSGVVALQGIEAGEGETVEAAEGDWRCDLLDARWEAQRCVSSRS
jgi:hypothetical protein